MAARTERAIERSIEGGLIRHLKRGKGAKVVADLLGRGAAAAAAIGLAPAAEGLAALGVAGSAAALALALGVGYAAGTGLRGLWERYNNQERTLQAAVSLNQARRAFKERAGRSPTKAENDYLAAAFRAAVAGASTDISVQQKQSALERLAESVR